jgi:phage terminase large subunit
MNLEDEKVGSIAGVTSVWIDEAHFITEEDWINIVASLGRSSDYANYFQFTLSFNPFGGRRHWLNKRFIESNPYNAKVYKTIFSDNKYLSKDYETILDATKNNTAYYTAAKFGDYADVTDAQVFRNYFTYNPVTHRHLSPRVEDYQCIVGLDWGHRNAACALLTATVKDTLIVFDEVYVKGLTTQQFINAIISKKWEKSYIYYCDCANPDKILEMQQNGFNALGVKKGPGSIAYSIDILLRMQVVIMPQCKNLIEEIGNYSYKFNEKTSELFNVPADHQSDDAVDALRYSVEGLMNEQPDSKAVMALY